MIVVEAGIREEVAASKKSCHFVCVHGCIFSWEVPVTSGRSSGVFSIFVPLRVLQQSLNLGSRAFTSFTFRMGQQCLHPNCTFGVSFGGEVAH